jgi:hypothetical protein
MSTYALGTGYFNSTVSNEFYITKTLTIPTALQFNSTVSDLPSFNRGTVVLKIPGAGGATTPTSGQIFPSGFR